MISLSLKKKKNVQINELKLFLVITNVYEYETVNIYNPNPFFMRYFINTTIYCTSPNTIYNLYLYVRNVEQIFARIFSCQLFAINETTSWYNIFIREICRIRVASSLNVCIIATALSTRIYRYVYKKFIFRKWYKMTFEMSSKIQNVQIWMT